MKKEIAYLGSCISYKQLENDAH